MNKKTRKPPSFSQSLIQRLIKPENLAKEGAWAREMKMLNTLKKTYSDKAFWSNVEIKLPSLAFFFTSAGKDFLQKVKNKIEYVKVEKDKVELSDNKLGEDIILDKPLSLKEFMKKYEK